MSTTIIIQSTVGHVCVDPEDGEYVATKAAQALLAGDSVALDFAGVTTLTGSFLGGLIGHLHNLAGGEAVDARLSVAGLDETDARYYELCVEQSKRMLALSPEVRKKIAESQMRAFEDGSPQASVSQWLPEPPKHRDHYLRGYYRAIAKDRASWLDGNPIEHVYLYFDGKYSVLRPGVFKGSQINEFSHWQGPMPQDALPPEVEAMLDADE